MAKKEGHAYHKPKPRVAVYGGIAVGLANMGGVEGSRGIDIAFPSGGSRGDKAKAVLKDLGDNPFQAGLVNGGGPAVAGILISIGADKIGINKVLAKMKAPFRV